MEVLVLAEESEVVIASALVGTDRESHFPTLEITCH